MSDSQSSYLDTKGFLEQTTINEALPCMEDKVPNIETDTIGSRIDDMEKLYDNRKEDTNVSLYNRICENESLKTDTNVSVKLQIGNLTDMGLLQSDSDDDESGSSSKSSDSYVSETAYPEMEIPVEPWGTYGLEDDHWNDDNKPFVRLRNYEDIKLNAEEKEGLLTERIIASCSSYLDRCPETGKYVLCKCNLKEKNLADISILTYHHYLQYLDLSRNMITNLECLSQLPFLMHLDVSYNMLTDLLNFKAPFNLTYVNFSYNFVDIIPDLTEFWSIVHLDLCHNQIFTISGLDKLRYLRHLNLSYNQIKIFQNLSNMELTHLNLSHNQITQYEENNGSGLSTLKNLVSLDLTDNLLKTLRLFVGVIKLQKLILRNNCIRCLYELEHLSTLRYLTEVDLQNNPIANEPRYYEVCVKCIKAISILDGEHVSAESKVEVQSKFQPSPYTVSAEKHSDLLKLEQLTSNDVSSMLIPFTKPKSPLIVLVGPPGSGKVSFVDSFYNKHKNHLCRAISYTTRPRTENEVEGECYHFITEEKFQEMVRNAEFVTVSEILGYSYGLTFQELTKCSDNRVLIVQTDLISSLNLRMRNIRPILILTLYLQNEHYYAELLKKYCYTYWLTRNYKALRIVTGMDKPDLDDDLATTSHIEYLLKDMIETLPVKDGAKEKKSSVKFTEDKPTMMSDIIYSELGSYCSSQESGGEHKSSESFEMVSLIKAEPRRSIDHTIEPIPAAIDQQLFGKGSMYQSISQVEFDIEPILSVVSEHILLDEDNDDSIMKRGNKMMRPNEKIESFIRSILALREDYIKFHRENPGIFRETIFTDKHDEAMEILETVLKEILAQPRDTVHSYSFETDPDYEEMIKYKLDNLQADIFTASAYTYDNYLCNL